MGIRMNNNYKTDKEFENFLEKIGGLKRTYRIDEKKFSYFLKTGFI